MRQFRALSCSVNAPAGDGYRYSEAYPSDDVEPSIVEQRGREPREAGQRYEEGDHENVPERTFTAA